MSMDVSSSIPNVQSQSKTLHEGPPTDEEAQMERYGIKKVLVDSFVVGEYRYTSLADAISAAKRQQMAAIKE